ncbi:Non-canonical purine NTP pyrophosphatase [Polystyrenella longa]|uniref:dITP/XTP pyrophosphatase n=1 Tax=Polystyrenella longa TaxID=2528007 RepID=A0A518CS21_9PLAN|nr:RdgB/HAM1 family non-canonical purine NTP pyrophosphatase [Polystyrenella longa]QDU82015.1 Non-canonical purine NTP pyrophosphatase [Polystyrenella longa]
MNAQSASNRLIIASRNQKKTGEIRDLLAPWKIEVKSVGDFPDVPKTIEDGETFAANAAKKAAKVATALNSWALGEDSGLCVAALGGAPGIYSARFSGENANDDLNNAKLQEELKNVSDDKRNAFYICHVAVSDSEGNVQLSMEAECHGRITRDPRGTNGFGYDPYFLIPEYGRTFGEFKPIVKRQISHRARAFRQLLPKLVSLLKQQ